MAPPDQERDTGALGAGEAGAIALGSLVAGRYRVEAVLGSGGWGRVYRVADTALDRVVALKTLRVDDPEALARFRREVRLASRVTHPNVIRLFDLGHWGALSFLTMEHVAGQSLRAHLAGGPLPVGEAAGIARQVALGLAASHACGIVHRDLKPENVLLGPGGRVVLADFGVAGEPTGSDPASAIVGTSAYMSPEQANGEAATPQADLYTLGLVLHEMLTGQVPLVGNGPVATALKRQREAAPPLRGLRPEVPEALEALVARLLEREPAARPRAAAEVAEALAEWATPVPSAAPTPSLEERPTAPRAGRPTRRASARWRRLAAGAALLAGLVLLAWRPWERAPVPEPRRAIIFGVSARADVALPPALAFLVPAVPGAAYRALAARLPGRVAPPGTPDPGAAPVQVSLSAEGDGYVATLRSGRHEGRGRAAAPVTALDAAAASLVARALPGGRGRGRATRPTAAPGGRPTRPRCWPCAAPRWPARACAARRPRPSCAASRAPASRARSWRTSS